jgi:isocitrate lyase
MNRDRWQGISRPYSTEDVERLRGSLHIEHTLARRGAGKLWELLHDEDCVVGGGAVTGGQSLQRLRAGSRAIWVPTGAPELVRRINRALRRADRVERAGGESTRDWYAPIVADAGFGGPLDAYERTAGLIEAGAAAVHFADQRDSALVSTQQFVRTLTAARLAADVLDVPTLLIARTAANEARGLAYAPFADLICCETSTPGLAEARRFAEAIHARFPGKLLAYSCECNLDVGALGYRLQLDSALLQVALGAAEGGCEAGTGYLDRISEIIGEGEVTRIA